MKSIFTNFRVWSLDLLVKNCNNKKCGNKSLMALGPKEWNAVPENVRKQAFFSKFKAYIYSWSGPSFKCPLVFGNYEKSLVLKEVFRNLKTFEKQPWKRKNFKWFWLFHGGGPYHTEATNRFSRHNNKFDHLKWNKNWNAMVAL